MRVHWRYPLLLFKFATAKHKDIRNFKACDTDYRLNSMKGWRNEKSTEKTFHPSQKLYNPFIGKHKMCIELQLKDQEPAVSEYNENRHIQWYEHIHETLVITLKEIIQTRY